jgi:hypothetical protein
MGGLKSGRWGGGSDGMMEWAHDGMRLVMVGVKKGMVSGGT